MRGQARTALTGVQARTMMPRLDRAWQLSSDEAQRK